MEKFTQSETVEDAVMHMNRYSRVIIYRNAECVPFYLDDVIDDGFLGEGNRSR